MTTTPPPRPGPAGPRPGTPAPVPGAAGPGPATAGNAADASRLEQDLAVLDTLADRPLTEHVAAYEQLHGRLQAALTEIDNA